MIEVWTHASTYTQRNGVSYDKEPSWVSCHVRSHEPAFDRVTVDEVEAGKSFVVNRTHQWRYADE